jgi:hypothetical protein
MLFLPLGRGKHKPILIVISAGWPDVFSEIMARKGKTMAKESGSAWVIKGLKIELTCTAKSPLAPLCQRGVISLPLGKGGEEGFYKTISSLL